MEAVIPDLVTTFCKVMIAGFWVIVVPILAVLGVYFVVRVGATAWFKTRHEYHRLMNKEKEKQNGP